MTREIERARVAFALETARLYQSKQTGWIHYNYQISEEETADTIPSCENFLFVLALFKTRQAEQILEAKALLEKLFFYQREGNYPVYLHEAPCCRDALQGIKIVPSLYWIYREFHQILGGELKMQVKQNLLKICGSSLKLLESNPFGMCSELLIGCSLFAVGLLFDEKNLEQKGAEIVDKLRLLGAQCSWYSRRGISRMLEALTMIYEDFSKSPWAPFWDCIKTYWHNDLECYDGPAFDEWQSGWFPESTLYDHFFIEVSKGVFKQPAEKKLSHLQSVVLPPRPERLDVLQKGIIEGSLEETYWLVKKQQDYSYSLIGARESSPFFQKQAFAPFSFLWKSQNTPCSLISSGGRISDVYYRLDQNNENPEAVDLFYTLPEPVENDHPLENRELLFFCSAIDGLAVTVEGLRATTFKTGEQVQISDGNMKIGLTFSLEQGEGDFLGHLMLGNRPEQLFHSKRAPGFAYDWQIFLRTLRKKGPCIIRVSFVLLA